MMVQIQGSISYFTIPEIMKISHLNLITEKKFTIYIVSGGKKK